MNRGREVLRGKLWERKRRISSIKKHSVEVFVYSASNYDKHSGQIEIFQEPIKTNQKPKKVILLADIKTDNGIQGGSPYSSLKTQSFRSTLKITETVWPFQIITKSGEVYEFFVDTKEDQEQWIKRLNFLTLFPYSPIPEEPTHDPIKEYFKIRLNAKDYNADSVWAVYILPEEVGSKINILGTHILALKSEEGHLSIISLADPFNPIVTWERDKIRRCGNFGNIVVVEIGRRCRGGPGLVWMYVGTENTTPLKETIHLFLFGNRMPISVQKQHMTREPTYSCQDILPTSYSREVSVERHIEDASQRLVKSDTTSYSSLDTGILTYLSSPISESNSPTTEVVPTHFSYLQENEIFDETRKYYGFVFKQQATSYQDMNTADLNTASLLSKNQKQTSPGSHTQLAIKQDIKEGSSSNKTTSINDIMLPATFFLQHNDDHKQCDFCNLISKQIEELFDPRDLLPIHSRSTSSLENLCGVHIAGKKQFTVQKDINLLQQINWDQYGLCITLNEVELSPSANTAEISVVALVGGQFKLPKNKSILHSQLKLEIQHCVNLTDEDQIQYLKFAIAPINSNSLPYEFKTVEEGQFAVGSWYGSIIRNKYSLVCIVGNNDDQQEFEDEEEEGPPPPTPPLLSPFSQQEEEYNSSEAGGVVNPQSEGVGTDKEVQSTNTVVNKNMTYVGLVYYKKDGVEVLVTFTTAKRLNALLEFIKNKHHNARIGQKVYFKFEFPSGFIELKFNAPQVETFDGWTISPHVKPFKLKQSDIDLFGEDYYPDPQACLISVYGSSNAVPLLHYGVPLEGVVDPVTVYIHAQLRTAIESIAPVGSELEERTSHINDAGTNLSEIFRKKHYFMLIDKIGKPIVVDRVVDHFFAINLISEATHSDVTSSNDTPYKKGSKIVKELYNLLKTSQNSRTILSSICNALNEHDQLKDIGQKIKQDMT